MTQRAFSQRTTLVQQIGITFDFHNTLFTCDDWFQLEVYDLVPAFLRWLTDQGGVSLPVQAETNGRRFYAELRVAIKEHGHEQNAASCIASVLDRLEVQVPESTIVEGVHAIMGAVAVAQPMQGVVETIRELAAQEIPLGIVSSAVYAPFLERSLVAHGTADAFAHVTTSASAGFYKTRPELFWHAAEAMNLSPANMLHVGDSLAFDVGGAQRAGFRGVWLSYGRGREAGGPEPDAILTDLTDSAPFLLRMVRDESPSVAAAI
jgi:FMN phosphatase YigB (HAD superfamily)